MLVDGPRLEGRGFVGIDDRGAMAELGNRLVSLGHREVSIITFRLAPDDRVGIVDAARLEAIDYRVTRERLHGAIGALTAAGVDPVVFEIGEDLRESAMEASLELLGKSRRPTAMMGTSDQIALGELDAAANLGLTVPEAVSVTGFDGVARPPVLD